jgi:uncharacterized protein (TIGR02246 family)
MTVRLSGLRARVLSILMCAMGCAVLQAQGDAGDIHAADRAQLRTLMYGMQGAINARDVAAMSSLMAEESSVYWLDGHHTRTKAEIQAHYQRMFGAEESPLKDLHIEAQLGAPAQFYGDAAVAFGTTAEHYTLRNGSSVDLAGKWTAVCAKQAGQWRVAALHFSIDPFENPILSKTRRLAWWLGSGGLVIGVLLGLLFGRRRRA